MKEWPPSPRDDDLERADDLLGQADALLRRHRGQSDMEAPRHAQDPDPAFDDDDDLPILTEIVEDLDLPPTWSGHKAADAAAASIFHTRPAPAPAVTTADQAGHRAAVAQLLAEKLVELDTEIARKVADWVAVEFQQVLDRELERLGERVRAEMLAHLRATLLPELSAQVSTLLDDSARPSATPDRS